jgi:hypothetical protein
MLNLRTASECCVTQSEHSERSCLRARPAAWRGSTQRPLISTPPVPCLPARLAADEPAMADAQLRTLTYGPGRGTWHTSRVARRTRGAPRRLLNIPAF